METLLLYFFLMNLKKKCLALETLVTHLLSLTGHLFHLCPLSGSIGVSSECVLACQSSVQPASVCSVVFALR